MAGDNKSVACFGVSKAVDHTPYDSLLDVLDIEAESAEIAAKPRASASFWELVVVPNNVVHPGLLEGWGC
jgi:hypothetical protein